MSSSSRTRNIIHDVDENNSIVNDESSDASSEKKKKQQDNNWFKRFVGWCAGSMSNIEDDKEGASTRSAGKEEMEHHAREMPYFTMEEREYLLTLRKQMNEKKTGEGNKKIYALDQLLEYLVKMEGSNDTKKDSKNSTVTKENGTNDEKAAEEASELTKEENEEILKQKMDEISARMNANYSSMPAPTTSMPPLAVDATKKQSSSDDDASASKRENDDQKILSAGSRKKRVELMLGIISVAREMEDFNVDVWSYILEYIFSASSLPATARTNCQQQGNSDNDDEMKKIEKEKQQDDEIDFLNNVASAIGRRKKHEDDTVLSFIFHACYKHCNERETGEENIMVDASVLIKAWYDTICLCHAFNQIIGNEKEEDTELARTILKKCYPTHDAKTDLKFLIQSLSSFGNHGLYPNSNISMGHFCSWSKEVLPLLSQPFTIVLNDLISVEDYNNVAARKRVMMDMNKESYILGENDNTPNPLVCTLSCMSSHFTGTWHRLYASDHDGFSFQSLQHSLLGYAGPTLLLIRSTSETNNIDGNSIIGAYTSTPIQNKGDIYFGNSSCFLFRLGSPDVRIYRPSVGTSRRFVFFKGIPPGKVRPDLSTHGWGFGGVARSPRLFIRGTFEDCTAAVRDTTYDHGPLLSTKDVVNSTLNFDVESLEVWGVGDDDTIEGALHSYGGYRRTADAALEKARKVDKAQFMGDFKSGMIESKMFVHREQMQMGRGECLLDGCVEDEDE